VYPIGSRMDGIRTAASLSSGIAAGPFFLSARCCNDSASADDQLISGQRHELFQLFNATLHTSQTDTGKRSACGDVGFYVISACKAPCDSMIKATRFGVDLAERRPLGLATRVSVLLISETL
jgi:hypothetical protein